MYRLAKFKAENPKLHAATVLLKCGGAILMVVILVVIGKTCFGPSEEPWKSKSEQRGYSQPTENQ
jgi:hypothetical protein